MGFFDRLFGKKNSAESAKERLQLVLIHDRTDLTPAELDSLKDDLIAVISRHVISMRIPCRSAWNTMDVHSGWWQISPRVPRAAARERRSRR